MKRIFCAALLLTICVMSLPRLFPMNGEAATPGEDKPEASAEPLARDAERSIRLLRGDEVVSMSVFDYLRGVVAAEMPVSFEPEALKAQAVAARTYLAREQQSPKHDNADICAGSGCCQAYLSDAELKESWGDKLETYMDKVRKAVAATDAQYLSYDGAPVLAAFHSSSDGATEDAGEIWSDVPYLTSVDSPETAEDVPNFVSTVENSELDFRDTILYACPDADMTGEADSWVGDVRRNRSGRVESVFVGGKELTGSQMRTLFKLRSTNFEISHSDGRFVFTVRGYGHGVGMSQYGANAMAASGADYRAILAHYYPNTRLVS